MSTADLLTLSPVETPPTPRRSYAPRVAPPGYLDSRRWSYESPPFQALGHSFRIRSDDRDVVDYLESVLAEFRTDRPAQSVYSLMDRRPRHKAAHALYADDLRIALCNSTSRVLVTLLWHINQEVVRCTDDTCVLWHASAAVRDGVCVVLPAPMESGKTTTVAGLLLRGYEYLTDEAVALDVTSLLVEPFPKALSIDRGSWPVLPALAPRLQPVDDQWQVPPRQIRADAVARPTRPRLVVAPQFRRGSRTELTPVRRAEMLALVAQSTFRFAEHARRNLQVAALVLTDCDCYRLVIGDLDEAVRLIDGLVDQVLAGAR